MLVALTAEIGHALAAQKSEVSLHASVHRADAEVAPRLEVLLAVPEVRRRYQIWHYLYPTNPPALYSARVMRGKLDDLRGFLDPDGKDPAMRRSVVIGHSMGGLLLAKSLAVEPRDALRDAVFTRPLSRLNVTPADRSTLREAFYWKPCGNVDRIIFCSVPFRGSRIASS